MFFTPVAPAQTSQWPGWILPLGGMGAAPSSTLGWVPVVGESKLGWQVRLLLPQPLTQNPGARQSVRCWQVGMQWGEVLALAGWAWCAVLLMPD